MISKIIVSDSLGILLFVWSSLVQIPIIYLDNSPATNKLVPSANSHGQLEYEKLNNNWPESGAAADVFLEINYAYVAHGPGGKER
jgi:hypothetical protein